MTAPRQLLRPAARWLAVCALVFHIAWLPVHLLTTAHCDTGPAHAHAHAQAHADHHGHSHGDADASQSHSDTEHHHFTGDHEAKFLAKRQNLHFAPLLAVWQTLELVPGVVAVQLPGARPPTAPPPTDLPSASSPRAPPLG